MICARLPTAESWAMPDRIRIIPHEAVPLCGSFEVRFPDGRPSRYFYCDDIAGRRLRPDMVDSAAARQAAQSLARIEQNMLDPD
jgi:hypothetical protein